MCLPVYQDEAQMCVVWRTSPIWTSDCPLALVDLPSSELFMNVWTLSYCVTNFKSLPSTDTELQTAADGFKSISSHGVVDSCIGCGCLDGVLLKIQTPSAKQAGNVKSYFSGHYQRWYGINVQAACYYQCQFISVCIAAPGGTNNIAAFRKTPLQKNVHELPLGKYIIGDKLTSVPKTC